MNRLVTITIAVLLLIIVIAVFISPVVDLQPTALRAAFWVAALFVALTVPHILFEGLAHGQLCGSPRIQLEGGVAPSPPLLDLNCARLC